MRVSEELKSLKKNVNGLLEALNNLPKDKLEGIKLYLESEAQGKENKIRLDVIECLISKGSITKEAIEEIKKEANVSYPTNILQSWRSYYSLFFVCFLFVFFVGSV